MGFYSAFKELKIFVIKKIKYNHSFLKKKIALNIKAAFIT
jgi:hypothetical protein